LSAEPPLAFQFQVDFVCSRSESRQLADCVEKLRISDAANFRKEPVIPKNQMRSAITRFKTLCACLLATLMLSGCLGGSKWNQRVTFHFTTPDGPMTLSSVTRAEIKKQLVLVGSVNPVVARVYGEAAMMLMGGDAYMFLLVPSAVLAQNTIPRPKDSGDCFQYINDQLGKPPTTVWKIGYRPKVIYYPDINDPLNPKEITPESIARVLGEGYSYDDITIEITKDPVTEGKIATVADDAFFDINPKFGSNSRLLKSLRRNRFYGDKR
jgi:hypothetical protein